MENLGLLLLLAIQVFPSQSLSLQNSASNFGNNIVVDIVPIEENEIHSDKTASSEEYLKYDFPDQEDSFGVENDTDISDDNVTISNEIPELTQLYPQNLTDYHQNLTHHKLKVHANLEKFVLSNVTCPELNNFTFNNEPPFNILGNPMCGNKVSRVPYS